MDIQEPQIISYYGLKKEQKKSTMDIQSILNDMVGVGEDKDTILKMFKKLEEENKQLKEKNKELKEEHQKFDEIWKTEGITEQDIIDMKRQISNQCDLITKLKEENKQLKKENKEIKMETSAYWVVIDQLGDYMERVDQNAVDVFNEITEDFDDIASRTLE